MKAKYNTPLHSPQPRCLSMAVFGLFLAQVACGQVIQNPSFEANSYSVAPGYIQDNAAITGWTANQDNAAGLSPAGTDFTFANNGAIPAGNNVAFIEWGGTSLSTPITGLTAGTTYNVTFRVNAATNAEAISPILQVSVDSIDLLALNVYAVGSTNAYATVSFDFTAGGPSSVLTLFNASLANHPILIDDFTVRPASKWSIEAWTSDADAGVDAQFVYTHAYNFGGGPNTTINNVPFLGAAGPNPAMADKFSTERLGSVFNNDGNALTAAGGGSALLARDFLYSATVPPGSPQTIRIQGLTPGMEYVATIYTVGWEAPSTTARWATISLGDERLTFNQDQFDNDYGLRLSCRYVADASGTAEIKIAPINPANVSIHIYGFSNREAVSRNVIPSIAAQPVGTTVAAGVPVNITVTAAGFPAPTYTWRRDGQALPGDTATYSIAQAQAQDAGEYDVIVANSVGSVTSVVARLIVGLPLTNPSFEADLFSSPPGYSSANGPITGWTVGNLGGAGLNPVSDGSSPFADNGLIPNGNQVLFIQGDQTVSQTINNLVAGSEYYLHYYENARSVTTIPALEARLGSAVLVPAHSIEPVRGSNPYHEVFSDVFTATAGAVDLSFVKTSPVGGDNTALIDNVSFVQVTPGTPVRLTRSPQPLTLSVGDNARFSGQGIGSLPLSYQWLKNGDPIPGQTSPTIDLTNIQKPSEGNYSVVITNNFGAVTSAVARLTVFEPIPDLINTGLDANRQPLADGQADPHWTLIENPDNGNTEAIVEDSTVFPIVGGPWLANSGSSKWIGPQLNTVASVVGFYIYRTSIILTERDPATVVIQGRWATDNSGREIRVNGVRTSNPESPGFGSWTPFAIYGTNVAFVAGTNTIDFVVENEVDPGYTGLKVEFLASNVAIPPGVVPEITSQPVSQTVAEGETVTFTMTAKGASPLSYQWFKDGTALTGQTGLSLTLTNVTTADNGAYTIRVSNASGQAVSQPAQLLVAYRPIPGVFGTGVAADGSLLPPGATDPHYILAESVDFEYPGPDAIVINDGFPIPPWLANGPSSRWIAPQAAQGTGNAEGDYTYQTSFNLTGHDITKVRLVGGWAVDNLGTDILVNGVSTGLTSAGFGGLATFTITNGLVAGVNTLDFKVNNAPVTPNPTGLRVDLRALIDIPQSTRPSLQATRSGSNLSISWGPSAAGQKLQVTTTLNGTWQDIPNASNPFVTNTTPDRLFFRVAQ